MNLIVLIDDLIASNRIDPFALHCHYTFIEFGFCFESNAMNIRVRDSRNVLKCDDVLSRINVTNICKNILTHRQSLDTDI